MEYGKWKNFLSRFYFLWRLTPIYAEDINSQRNIGLVTVGPSLSAGVSNVGPTARCPWGGFELGAQPAEYAILLFEGGGVTGNSSSNDCFTGICQLTVLLQKATRVSENGVGTCIEVGVGAAYGEAGINIYFPSYYYGMLKMWDKVHGSRVSR